MKAIITLACILFMSFINYERINNNYTDCSKNAIKGSLRPVSKVVNSDKSQMGFITVKQPLPSRGVNMIDPFLLLHHHGPHNVKPNNNGLPFGPHPHRGFETVTFIFKGDVKHKDSNGFESVIKSGGVQWMTAGKGLIHSERSSEEFKEKGGPLEIIQLWINLPASQKMADPNYEGLQESEIPALSFDEGKVKVNLVSGTWGDKSVPQRGLYPVDLVSIEMKSGGSIEQPIDIDKNILFYIQTGELEVNGQKAGEHQLVLFENEGEVIKVKALADCKIVIGAAKPIGEKVVSKGPFVMNSQEELKQAIQDYRGGKMGQLME